MSDSLRRIRRRTWGQKERDDWTAKLYASPEVGRCPTPHKIGWLGRKEAKAAIRRMKGVGKTGDKGRRLHAYRCVCGRFHCGAVRVAGDNDR